MDVLLLCAAILVLAAFVAAPLYRRQATGQPAGTTSQDARRQAVDRALDDLEIDLASGLIDRATYAVERARLTSTD